MHEMYILSSLIPVLILLWIYVKNVWIDINEQVTTRLYIFLINLDKANIGNDLFSLKFITPQVTNVGFVQVMFNSSGNDVIYYTWFYLF